MGRLRLGELLILERKIDDTQLKSGLAYQRRWGKKLGESLVILGFISELDLCQTLSKAMRIPLIDVTKIDSAKVTREVLDKVTVQQARASRVVPLAIKSIRGKTRLVVASSDPTNYKFFDDLQFKLSMPILVMVAPDSDVEWFIRKYYLGDSEALPLNYIDEISVVTSSGQVGSSIPDPISSIFWDENFTGVTNMGRPPYAKPIKRKSDED